MSYPRRNRWKKGDWLVVDDESGLTKYASDLRMDYKGLYVHKRYADSEHPQDFVKAASDPRPVPFANQGEQTYTIVTAQPTVVGNTSIATPQGPASHLFV